MWVLWAAYDLGSFPLMKAEMTKEEFAAHVRGIAMSHSSMLIVEDKCRYFREGRGPVALVTIDNLVWRIEPFCDFFRWTTPRMKLRVAVSFLTMLRSDKAIRFSFWHCIGKFEKFYDRMRDYGIPVGKVPVGDGEFMFHMRGKRAQKG